ncbi:MAG: hydrogenase nickel incorporation protein HypB [Marinilabiliaceae bacterium]|jgi:hydrogenase nickel incorporation protein HypB|nr:hydrogenase nickel incorporation protein HypB [Marinilabiliaceae bacterium]
MCDTCGCSEESKTVIRMPGKRTADEDNQHHDHYHGHEHHDHDHHHGHEHHDHDHQHDHSHHDHSHNHGSTYRKVELETDILARNSLIAERNRGFFEGRNIFAVNMMSSPGSGKTTLLERTVQELRNELSFYVIEGDQQTDNDAARIEAAGATAIQVNTGSGCHLDAEMVNKATRIIDPPEASVLMIENVGNLVCPSLFDLGECKRVVIISVTEGDDKPLKYPSIFRNADLCIINKTDLLPYVDFNVEKAKEYGLRVNHHLQFIELSATKGEGVNDWYSWIRESRQKELSQ